MSQPGNPPPDVPSATAPASCPQCGGDGWYTEMGPNTFVQTCWACICLECRGRGLLLAGVARINTEVCEHCQGTGRRPA
jgi:DnaJ-class molecular chaperone